MIIDSVYLLLPDGRCIFSKSYIETEIDPHLLGGLLNAFNIASNQWLKEGVRKFVSEEGRNFIIKDFSSFLVVIAGVLNADEEIILEKIGLKFLSKHGATIEKWQEGNVGILKDFEQDLNKILNVDTDKGTSRILIKGQKLEEAYLDSLTIISLPKDLQKTALALLTLKEATIESISKETKRSIEEEKRFVEELVKLGYIRKQIKTNTDLNVYFLPTNY